MTDMFDDIRPVPFLAKLGAFVVITDFAALARYAAG